MGESDLNVTGQSPRQRYQGHDGIYREGFAASPGRPRTREMRGEDKLVQGVPRVSAENINNRRGNKRREARYRVRRRFRRRLSV